MTGSLYDIRIHGRHDNLPHPHLVAVEHGDNCLCIPAFTQGGHELDRTLKALERLGIFSHECAVEIHHAKHVTFADGRAPHVAVYVVARRQVLSKSAVLACRRAGQMDDAGLLKVLECILLWNKTKPTDLPPKLVKAAGKVHADLLAKLRRPTP